MKHIILAVYVFPDDLSFVENRTIPSRSASRLSGSSGGSGGTWGPRYSSNSFVTGPDDSEGDEERSQCYSLYQSHVGPFGRASQDSLNSVNPPPQVSHPAHLLVIIFRTQAHTDLGLDSKSVWRLVDSV